jgi:uncharacterized OsmC-like protein
LGYEKLIPCHDAATDERRPFGSRFIVTASPVTKRHVLHCRTVASGGFQHLNYVRDLPPLALEERFGLPTDAAVATPSETLLAALGSCLGARIHANAVAGSIVVESLEIDVEVDVGASPMWGGAGADPLPVGFEAIRVAVHIEANASPEALHALINHAKLWSPVANTLHNPVHLDVTIKGAGNSMPPSWDPKRL